MKIGDSVRHISDVDAHNIGKIVNVGDPGREFQVEWSSGKMRWYDEDFLVVVTSKPVYGIGDKVVTGYDQKTVRTIMQVRTYGNTNVKPAYRLNDCGGFKWFTEYELTLAPKADKELTEERQKAITIAPYASSTINAGDDVRFIDSIVYGKGVHHVTGMSNMTDRGHEEWSCQLNDLGGYFPVSLFVKVEKGDKVYTFSVTSQKDIDWKRICAENKDANILSIEITDDVTVHWMFRKTWLRKAPQDMLLGKYTNVVRTLEGNEWSKKYLPNDWVSFITSIESKSVVLEHITAIRAKMVKLKIEVSVTPI